MFPVFLRRYFLPITLIYVAAVLLIVGEFGSFFLGRVNDLLDSVGIAFLAASIVIFVLERRLPALQDSKTVEQARQGLTRLDYLSEAAEVRRATDLIREALLHAAVVRIAANYRLVRQLDLIESLPSRGPKDLAILLPDVRTAKDDPRDRELSDLVLTMLKHAAAEPNSGITVRLGALAGDQTVIITEDVAFVLVRIGYATEPGRSSYLFVEGDRRSELRELCLLQFQRQWIDAVEVNHAGEAQ